MNDKRAVKRENGEIQRFESQFFDKFINITEETIR